MLETSSSRAGERSHPKIEGDTLTVCYDQKRDTTVSAFGVKQKGQVLIVFEKRK
jgi:hypothetical protein